MDIIVVLSENLVIFALFDLVFDREWNDCFSTSPFENRSFQITRQSCSWPTLQFKNKYLSYMYFRGYVILVKCISEIVYRT